MDACFAQLGQLYSFCVRNFFTINTRPLIAPRLFKGTLLDNIKRASFITDFATLLAARSDPFAVVHDDAWTSLWDMHAWMTRVPNDL